MGKDLQATIRQIEGLLGVDFAATLKLDILSIILQLVIYVFTAMALYAIAKRRGLSRPWLAWIPVANAWVLGCLSDQYQAAARGQTKRRRKTLLWTQICMIVAVILMLVLAMRMFINILEFGITDLKEMETMGEAAQSELLDLVMEQIMGIVLLAVALIPLSIVYVVYHYIALYDIYLSCEPASAKLYLVLSILIGYAEPACLFMNRNKDGGMPFIPMPLPGAQTEDEQYTDPWEETEE